MDILVSSVGWVVHFLMMLSYLAILTAPAWVAVWLILEWSRNRTQAEER